MGDVVSFHRPGGQPQTGPVTPAALQDKALHTRTRRAPPGTRALAARQAGEDRRRYEQAAGAARREKLVRAGKVVPARITIALDLQGLHGPQVDEQVGTWHGNPDGDIDRWEQAIAVPSREQVQLLAALTGFPPAWFYEPIEAGPQPGGPIWMCGTRCELVAPHVITAGGVLLYEGQPREPVDTCPAPLPGMPVPEAAPPRKRAPAARKRVGKPSAVQPALPTRMPAGVRAQLDEMFAARRSRTGAGGTMQPDPKRG
jgi:hypothetical protein